MLIDKTTIQYINPALKFSIKKYFPLKEKTLLYDALLFCSVISKTPMRCSSADLEAFSNLMINCKELDISLEKYLSCAYAYIKKYSTPGHRLGISYFLNDSVIEYCGSMLEKFTSSSLFLEQVKNDILSTEKSIRELMTETSISYEQSFGNMLKNKKISSFFLAYKKFCNSVLVKDYNSEYFMTLVNILEPFFTYILAKNNVYSPHRIQKWNNSKIEDFSFCSVYFTDRYITNELIEECLGNEATENGTKLHSIFESIFTRYNKNKVKNLKNIALKYFKSTAYLDIKKELPEHMSFIEELFTKDDSIFYSLLDENTQVLVEHTMNANLAGFEFYGTADLIFINNNKAYIFDYKSSKLDEKYLTKNNDKYNKQISLYAKLLKEEHPELISITGKIIYTRGLLHPFDKLNDNIHIERALDIEKIKKTLKSGILMPNTRNCFLCRHPACKFRTRPSIWAEDGSRKISN